MFSYSFGEYIDSYKHIHLSAISNTLNTTLLFCQTYTVTLSVYLYGWPLCFMTLCSFSEFAAAFRLRFSLQSLCSYFVTTHAPRQSSENSYCATQPTNSPLQILLAPGVYSVLTSNKEYAKCCRDSNLCHSRLSAVHFLSFWFLVRIKIILPRFHIFADTCFHVNFTFFFPANILALKPHSPPPPRPDPSLWATWSFWEWLLLAGGGKNVKIAWRLGMWMGGGLETLSRLLEPLLAQAKQEWQQDSAWEVSPFTAVSQREGGRTAWQRSTDHANTDKVAANTSVLILASNT